MSNLNEELKQAADATVESSAPETETNTDSIKTDDAGLKDQSESQEETQDSAVDFKAELEALKKERDNYKEGLLAAKKKLKDDKEPEETLDDDLSLEEDLASKDIRQVIREELDTFKQEASKDSLNEALGDIATSDDEKELIKFHYDNTIQKSGFSRHSIAQDLRKAKLLANEKKILQENEELAVALRSRATQSGAAVSSSRKQTEPAPQFNAREKKLLEKFGVDPKDVPTSE